MDNQQPHGVPPGAPKRSEPSAPLSPSGAARRRLGLSGVILTLASQRSMASVVCKSPSGALSGNLSNPEAESSCTGHSPGYWRRESVTWPAEVLKTALFSAYFPCDGTLGQVTALDIVTYKYNDDIDNVGRHLMCALLNVYSGRVPPEVLTHAMVMNMWSQWKGTPFAYAPSSGATPWTGSQLTDYLKSTYLTVDSESDFGEPPASSSDDGSGNAYGKDKNK